MCKRLIFLIFVALVLCLGGNASAKLKALWEFDENSGTSVQDTVGGYTGTLLADPAWVDGNDCGKALEFDKQDDCVRIGSSPEFSPTGSFSVSLWAYISDWTTEWGDVMVGNRGDDGQGWCVRHFGSWWPGYPTGNAVSFATAGIGNSDDNVQDSPSNTIPQQNEWIHIACVYNSVTHKKYIYFDGVQNAVRDTNATEGELGYAPQDLYIGARSNPDNTGPDDGYGGDTEGYFFKGKLDDVRFYDHALSPAEVIPSYTTARKAYPANNCIYESVATNVTLTWAPGCNVSPVTDYHVWFDEDFSDVNQDAQDANEGKTGGTASHYIAGLVRAKTYYWRIDTISGLNTYRGYVWHFTVKDINAYDPDPCDSHGLVTVEPILSWVPGVGAKTSQNVYFDNNFNDVNNAPKGSTSDPFRASLTAADTNWAPSESGFAQLNVNTTYYWRIDEVDGGTIYKGRVWRFTTVPVPRLGSILREVWIGIGGTTVENLTNDARYPDNPSSTYSCTSFDAPAGWGDNYGTRMHGWHYVWDSNERTNSPLYGSKNYTFWIASVEDSQLWLSPDSNPDHASMIAYVEVPEGNDPPGHYDWTKYPSQRSVPIYLEAGKLYYIMALHKAGAYSGDHVEVAWNDSNDADDAEVIAGYNLVPYLQTASFRPIPNNNATDVRSEPTLKWTPGAHAVKHDIYFGTDEDKVSDANRTNPLGVLVEVNVPTVSPTTTYDIANDVNVGLLKFDTTYYWRIDDINESGPYPYLWQSGVWSFTTDGHHSVEDFERYFNPAITDVWKISGGAIIDESTDTEFKQVHEDDEAMYCSYNNSASPFYSETYAKTGGGTNSLDFVKNWRLQNIKALTLWFLGGDFRGSFTGLDPYTIEADSLGLLGYQTTEPEKDYFYFVHRYVAGQKSGEIKARVGSIDATSTSAIAGVMIRQSTAQNSKYAAVYVTAGNRVIYQQRRNDGSTYSTTVSGITLPHWVKIGCGVSGADLIWIAEHAEDNNGAPGTWTEIAGSPPINPPQPQTLKLTLSNNIYLGLCVSSKVYGEMCTAGISNVGVQSPLGTAKGDPDTGQNVGWAYNDPEKMYVVLKDSAGHAATVYYPGTTNPAAADANVTKLGEWAEWRIDLKTFKDAGVDVCDVNNMYIGFGNRGTPAAGGSGVMFIDDIRLYQAQFYDPECDDWPPDLARDGDIDFDDVNIIADNWLVYDYNVVPVAPPNPPVSWYKLEQNTLDFYGVHNGTPNGVKITDYVSDRMEGDWALDLKGDANSVNTVSNAAAYGIDGNKPRTITAWVKARSFDEGGIYEIGAYGGKDQEGQEFSMRTLTEPNDWRAQHYGGVDWDIDFTYPSQDKWMHLAHTYDGTTVKIYADGYFVAERAIDINTASASAKNFSIGQWGDYYFDGIVDDVRIYNYALSQGNVAYIAGKTSEFTQPLELLLTPANPEINLYVDRPDDPNNIINFKDIAVLGNVWGEKQIWPTW
jgi:hypothetical protein